MIDRERKVDIESLSPDRVAEIAVQLGETIKEIENKTILEVNKLLNIYGMEAKMSIVIGKMGQFDQVEDKPKKKRKPRKKKEANL